MCQVRVITVMMMIMMMMMMMIGPQINTDPMQSQLAYLDIVEPPSILSTDTSADQRVGL